MVTEMQYMTALRMVEQYHSQIGLVGESSRRTVFDLQTGDTIKCIQIRRNSMSGTLTKGKVYIIVNRSGEFVWLRNDKGRVNRYELSVEHWSLPD